jgi:hypothetical protein
VAVVASTDGDRKPTGDKSVPTDRIQRWLYTGRRQHRRLFTKHRTVAGFVAIAVATLLVILGLTVYGSTRDRAVVLPEVPGPPEVTLTATIGPSLDPSTDPVPDPTIPSAPPVAPGPTAQPAPQPPQQTTPPRRPPPGRVVIPTTFIEAESAANTLTGSARTHSEENASGGLTIGNLGRGNANALRFNNVRVPQSGTFTLTVFYISGDENRNAAVSVNGTGSVITFPATGDWDTVGSLTTRVNLRAGANTINLTNAAGPAPDIDRIRLSN